MNRVTTEKDKYAVVVSNLLFKVVHGIPRTVASKERPYTVLKELVVKETDLSDYQRSEKLHTLPALGDQRPSELLVSIRNLQPIQDCGCYCARYQFLSRMPPITRAQKDRTVDKLAALADTIMLSQASLHNLIEMGNGLPVSRFLKSGYNQVTMDPGLIYKSMIWCHVLVCRIGKTIL